MKRFRFPLERVLRQRALREAIAEQALATAVREADVAARDLARVRDRMTRGAAALRAALAEPLCGSDVALHARYAAANRVQELLLRERRAATLSRVQETRTSLRECRRAREAVAQLENAARAHYVQAMAREMQAALDEVAAVRHATRRSRTEG